MGKLKVKAPPKPEAKPVPKWVLWGRFVIQAVTLPVRFPFSAWGTLSRMFSYWKTKRDWNAIEREARKTGAALLYEKKTGKKLPRL